MIHFAGEGSGQLQSKRTTLDIDLLSDELIQRATHALESLIPESAVNFDLHFG